MELDNTETSIAKILREIIIKKIKEANSYSALAKQLKLRNAKNNSIKGTDLIFQKAIKIMLNNGLAYSTDLLDSGRAKKIDINLRKVEDFLRKESKEFKAWETFIMSTTPLAHTG